MSLTKVLWPYVCPACQGDGEVSVEESPHHPLQVSPEYHVEPCGLCGGYEYDGEDGWEYQKGEGVLPAVVCGECREVVDEGGTVWEDEAGGFLCDLCAVGEEG